MTHPDNRIILAIVAACVYLIFILFYITKKAGKTQAKFNFYSDYVVNQKFGKIGVGVAAGAAVGCEGGAACV